LSYLRELHPRVTLPSQDANETFFVSNRGVKKGLYGQPSSDKRHARGTWEENWNVRNALPNSVPLDSFHYRRYQSVTNWFQNQRSLAKKRLDDDPPSLTNRSLIAVATQIPRPISCLILGIGRPLRRQAFPPRSSHPSVSALIKRERRSPSAERSNASSSSRGPYHSILPSHRPRRTRPEPHQLEALQKLYNRTSNPSIEERGALALEVGMYVVVLLFLFLLSTYFLFRQGPRESNQLVPQPPTDNTQTCSETRRGRGYRKCTARVGLCFSRSHPFSSILILPQHA
jgi:hypothetical protein